MPEALVVGVVRQAIELALMVSLPMLARRPRRRRPRQHVPDRHVDPGQRARIHSACARDLRDLRADVSVDASDDLRIRRRTSSSGCRSSSGDRHRHDLEVRAAARPPGAAGEHDAGVRRHPRAGARADCARDPAGPHHRAGRAVAAERRHSGSRPHCCWRGAHRDRAGPRCPHPRRRQPSSRAISPAFKSVSPTPRWWTRKAAFATTSSRRCTRISPW